MKKAWYVIRCEWGCLPVLIVESWDEDVAEEMKDAYNRARDAEDLGPAEVEYVVREELPS